MLKVTLKEGESLAIGGNITVKLKQIATSRRGDDTGGKKTRLVRTPA